MLRGCFFMTFALLAVASVGQSVIANEPHEHGAPVRQGQAAAEDGAAPSSQGGILTPMLDLTIWSIVVFLVLLFVLSKYAWGPMMKGLEAREHAIHQAVDEAHKAREETSRLRDEVLRERAKAAEEARATVEQARRDAQKQADELRAKAVADIHAERDRMRRDLEIARDAALQDLWSQTAKLAALISSRAIGRELNPEDHRKLADQAIAEIRHAGAERQRDRVGV
jgi:F-type H+-transporting ATPase subunit b